MSSFKLKLVLYFLLLSLLPLAAAFWGFGTVARQGETRLADARLQAGLRAALASYEQELRSAADGAAALARRPAFERALARRDRPALTAFLAARPRLAVVASGGLRVGRTPTLAVRRRVSVYGPHGPLGVVVASVTLDSGLTTRLRANSGLGGGDLVAVVSRGRVLTARGLSGTFDLTAGRPQTVTLGGAGYRALVGGPLRERAGTALAVLTPQARIDRANSSSARRLLLGLLACLALIGLFAYLEGRTIVRTIRRLVDAANAIADGKLSERVPERGRDELALLGRSFNKMAGQLQSRLHELEAERARLREAISRSGEALAASHDPDQLRRVIVETAVEGTNALGGRIVDERGDAYETGEADDGSERIQLPLTAGRYSFGFLELSGDGFDDEDRMTAASFAAHAVVALENARLHGIVERQALVDGLTGLANRRQCEETLADELARSERFDTPLTIVLADLDDFKAVNDRHGHPVGDVVLREFAADPRRLRARDDVAGRWGGEEFVLVLPGTDAGGGTQLAERIREALSRRTVPTPEGEPLAFASSFGVAAWSPGTSQEELVTAADAALYEAKRRGKNRVVEAKTPLGGVRAGV